MGKDPLMAALEDDARAQSSRIIEEAAEAREAALAKARDEAELVRQERLAGLKVRVARERAAALNTARTNASGLKLGVRHELIGGVLDEAVRRFTSLPGDGYPRLLNQLYSELMADWERMRPGETPVVHINPADATHIRAEGAVFRADESVSAGIVLTSADGRVRFENTLTSRVEKAGKTIIPAINEMLFDDVLEDGGAR